ncbi:hypothetical protein B0A49_00156 [Cryomyces minteri]|uniref:F-box domain-containing protein n=1 Tax=Cryomyces minteri TaxID=331657 RepID=A0A4U0Y1K0_9PEZI|nr:hypothetical protein B0A49_00156 [Cryomyces minteri]
MNVDQLPAEIVLHIVSFLEPIDTIRLQSVSRSFFSLTRDDKLWKTICFDNSRAEALRRRQELMSAQEPSLVALRQAMSALPGRYPAVHDPSVPQAEMQSHRLAAEERRRAMANWDPSYPGEKTNYYQEYTHRHAPIHTSWLQTPTVGGSNGKEVLEVTGMGTLCENNSQMVDKVIAPLEDGSVCIWDIGSRPGDDATLQGRIVGRSSLGLLSRRGLNASSQNATLQSKATMTETGAIECVSVDSRQRKAFFAVQSVLNEVDLDTLQVVSQKTFPFPITVLSEARHPTPLTIGTNMTLHLHDPRDSQVTRKQDSSLRCELIGGAALKSDFRRLLTGDHHPSHATLSQPGPLSILHLPTREWDGNGDIWVGGRFTSLLNYDRRVFPKLRGTVHSGARISCLTSLPYPYIPRELDLMRNTALSIADVLAAKSIPGHTIVAAAEYKGKGSLELYGLSSEPAYATLSSDGPGLGSRNTSYQNRQTASSSKLLSVAAHGTRLVFADGDGNLKWVERDGVTQVRSYNINQAAHEPYAYDAGNYGLFANPNEEPGQGDIVQKIVPTHGSGGGGGGENRKANQDNLLLWTGDGRLGLLGFGAPAWEQSAFEERAESAEEASRLDAERQYGQTMRRALERQADEVRFVRGLGLGFGFGF